MPTWYRRMSGSFLSFCFSEPFSSIEREWEETSHTRQQSGSSLAASCYYTFFSNWLARYPYGIEAAHLRCVKKLSFFSIVYKLKHSFPSAESRRIGGIPDSPGTVESLLSGSPTHLAGAGYIMQSIHYIRNEISSRLLVSSSTYISSGHLSSSRMRFFGSSDSHQSELKLAEMNYLFNFTSSQFSLLTLIFNLLHQPAQAMLCAIPSTHEERFNDSKQWGDECVNKFLNSLPIAILHSTGLLSLLVLVSWIMYEEGALDD
jgi:hypothetical protein